MPPAPVALAPPASDQLVLVLDDDEAVRQTLCDQLHPLGYLTLECADGHSALTLLQQTPEIALLVSDLMLQDGLNGAEVIRQAQRLRPGLATLLISGQDLRQQQDADLPPCEQLAKPFSQQQLASALRRSWRRASATAESACR